MILKKNKRCAKSESPNAELEVARGDPLRKRRNVGRKVTRRGYRNRGTEEKNEREEGGLEMPV